MPLRYEVVSIGTTFDDDHWGVIRERYAGRDWPRFWRQRWVYDGCIGTHLERANAERLLAMMRRYFAGGTEKRREG